MEKEIGDALVSICIHFHMERLGSILTILTYSTIKKTGYGEFHMSFIVIMNSSYIYRYSKGCNIIIAKDVLTYLYTPVIATVSINLLKLDVCLCFVLTLIQCALSQLAEDFIYAWSCKS
jgi:hypothetical protein